MNYYNLTNPQRSIWLTEKFYQGTSINTICGYFSFNTKVNFTILKKAINEMVKTNDGMRLKVTQKEGNCLQYLEEYSPFDIDTIELSSEKEVRKTALKFANTPFFSENDFLFKVLLFKLPNCSGGFFMNVHHLIGDSWSLGLIAKDIARIYSELLSNNYKSQLQPSYINYINAENDYKNSDKYVKDKAYWDDVFKTIPEIASISSTSDEKKSKTSCKGARKEFLLDENKLNNIKAFCDKYKISIYNFFMAVYAVYVSKFSGLDDFVIGTPVLNRTNFEQKHTMGMFISVAPLRINLNSDNSFIDFAKKVAVDTTSIFRHQKYSYQTIIEDIRKKDASIPSLYNILLSYQITKAVEENNSINYTTDWLFNGNAGDELQIHLFDINDENKMTIAYDYKSEQFDNQDITDLHNRILVVINQIVENHNLLLKDLEIITPEEKHKILCDFNNTVADYPHNQTIIDLFEEQVQKTPDNIAIEYENIKISYKELNSRVNQLSNYLNSLNLTNKKNIGIFTNRTIDTLIGILSILKLGSTFVPIDSLYPGERINHMLKTAQLDIVLSSFTDTPNIDIPIINIAYNKYSNLNKNFENKPMSPLDNLYIIFTSGSTGIPKGLGLSHKNMANLIYFEKNTYSFLEQGNKILQFATMSFDVSYQEIFSAFLSGCTLVLIDESKRKNMDLMTEYIVEHNITTLFIPPAYLRLLAENDNNICLLSKTLKYIITAGEALLITEGIRKLMKNNIELHNHYGPAETHVATTYLVPKDISSSVAPIGKPISNTHVYILDSNNNLCPVNVHGQIAISGDCVGNGYINNDKLTSEKFIPDLFEPAKKMYLTGDIGFIDRNNIINFIGRNDNQVKINGFRIEPDEITKNILQYNGITSSCTIIKEYHSKKYIISYYTANIQVTPEDLREFLSRRLAKYLMPYKLVKLDKLPININGKVDKKALPEIQFDDDIDFCAPKTHTEEKLLKLWLDVLELDKISTKSDFFAFGGDSLLAIKLIALINQEFKINISINRLFDNPTICALAKYLDSVSASNNNNIKKAPKLNSYPLSSPQKRIYYSCSQDSNFTTLYNIAGGVVLDKILDINKLEHCFNLLISRHEALRTHFEFKNDEIVQVIDDKINFSLKLEETNNTNLNDIYTKFVKPFDLSKAPLFRVKLLKLDNGKMLLLLDMHHIISDGTSLNLLLQELCDLYNGLTLPEKQIDYTDFTLWEKEQFEEEEFKNIKNFWVNQFKDEIPLLNLPTTYPRPSVQSFEGSNFHENLPEETVKKIKQTSKTLGVTPYMLMLSAYYVLLSKYTSQNDIVVGTPVVGRQLPEVSGVIGMFVNTLALRNKIDYNLTFSEFCNIIKENCLKSFNNQSYPFDMLVKDLAIKRDTTRNPLFDTMFIYQNDGYPEIKFNNVKSEYFIPDNNVSKFDLSLEIVPINNQYHLRFEYCAKLFSQSYIKRFALHYTNILNTILENISIKLSDIDMLSTEERNEILYNFNNTKIDYPKNKTIIELFEEQVEKTPNAIAVVFEDQQLTYKQLNEKANQLARFLIANDVSTGDFICILLDKSLEMIVSILGILKIGATYVPIDIGYPNERIDYIIRDTKSKVLITNDALIHKSNSTAQPLCIDLESNQIASYDCTNLNINYEVDNLAYMMYTSGSTGSPKGVMITHQNIVRLVKNNNFIKFNKKERILQTGSIVFDACTFEIWASLLNGFELYIIKKEELLDASLLQDYLIKNKISILWLTAPLFNQLCEDNPHMFRNVRVLLTGGDVLSPRHINMVKSANPNLTIINGYGPTENTTFSCCFTIDKSYKDAIPIGKPISNSTAYVVSSNEQLQPIGVPGELWVGGDGVGKGYFNNPDLTSKKFISNPFGSGIIYKTGDLVSWREDGAIDFIGRIDNQVKIRGFRVELGEINLCISKFDGIKESFTTVNQINGEKVICTYFVANHTISIANLKNYLKNFLPIYMIPTYFMQLDKFPINANGKVDKNALPVNFKKLSDDNRKIKEPSSESEKLLLSLFKKILNNDNIGVDDSFFEVGGDSLTAMKLQVEAISNNLNISYSDIFKYSTVENLVKNLNAIPNTQSENYDHSYDTYNSLLANNTLEKELVCFKTAVGNVLLTGFTGFLGAHILDSFIKNEKGKIYCLIRNKNNMTARERLFNVLHFYFENKYDMLVDDRIILIEGDITLDNLGLSKEDYKKLGNTIDTVIHSAALVKHYGMYDEFEKINVNGTKNIVTFAKKFNAKLLHISTISVSGNNLAEGSNIKNNFEHEMNYDETNFYIGQNLDNLYVKSKFEAEKVVFDAIKDGLSASILRMGNLTSRFSEGKFQQNHFENAFVNRLKSFLQIGIFPKSLLNLYCEFTPIDFCGEAIIKIAGHFNKDYTVFHLLNEKHVYLDRLFAMLNEIGIHTKLVSDNEFANTIQSILNEPSKRQYIEGIVNDLTADKKLSYKSEVNIKSDFTKEFLFKTGFEWPYIDINYIRNYFKYLTDIGYFNI